MDEEDLGEHRGVEGARRMDHEEEVGHQNYQVVEGPVAPVALLDEPTGGGCQETCQEAVQQDEGAQA